jgi:hypothetical protein
MQMLRVFFPETNEVERRQLAVAVPPSVCAVPGLYDSLSFGLLQALYDAHLPRGPATYCKAANESVRQMLGALGLGDLSDLDARNAVFDQVDVDRDGQVRPSHVSTSLLAVVEAAYVQLWALLASLSPC